MLICVAGSWSTIREVSFMLGALARLLPLSPPAPLQPLLTAAQADEIGHFFVSALATAKHNGATEKLHLGLMVWLHHASSMMSHHAIAQEELRVCAPGPGPAYMVVIRRLACGALIATCHAVNGAPDAGADRRGAAPAARAVARCTPRAGHAATTDAH